MVLGATSEGQPACRDSDGIGECRDDIEPDAATAPRLVGDDRLMGDAGLLGESSDCLLYTFRAHET